jgi:hypothetical protein
VVDLEHRKEKRLNMKLVNTKYTSNRKNYTVKFDMETKNFVVFNNFSNSAVISMRRVQDAWAVAKSYNLDGE